MIIKYLNDEELMNIFLKGNSGDIPWGDYYRKYVNLDKDQIFGLYYKDYFYAKSLDSLNISEIEEYIRIHKDNWNEVDDRPWEYHIMGKIFALITRIKDSQVELIKNNICKFNRQIISGIAIFHDYPVGTFFPKEILNYKSLTELKENDLLTNEDIELIFNIVELWVKSLIKNGVYPNNIYLGNILVNPNDYSDVILDGLDGPCVCRVENNNYVETLAKRGLDLKESSLDNIYKLKESITKNRQI